MSVGQMLPRLGLIAVILAAAGCNGPILRAKKKLPGLVICGAFHEGLALVMERQSGRYGYIDAAGAIVIPPQFLSALPFSEGLAAVEAGSRGKYGYIDKTGATVVSPGFDAAFSFSEGLAAFRSGGRYGFVGKSGLVEIPARFDGVRPFSEGLAVAIDAGLAGWIDTSGAWVARPAWFRAGPFRNGLARACGPTRCGYLNRQGGTAIPFLFDDAADFSEGLAPVRSGAHWGYIDARGAWVVPPSFDEAQEFREGAALVGKIMRDPPDRGYGGYSGATVVHGFIDRAGRYLIQPSLLHASSFSEGRARVRLPARGFCSDCYELSYIDKAGKLLARFRSAGDFRGGAAVVTGGISGDAAYLIDPSGRALLEFEAARHGQPENNAGRPDVSFGYIDRSGRTVIPFEYSSAEPFADGVALVTGRGRTAHPARYIDHSGSVRLQAPGGAARAESFSEGLALVRIYQKGVGRISYIDKSGRERITGTFDEGRAFSGGMAAVRTSATGGAKAWGYVDLQGRMKIPPAFFYAGPFVDGVAAVAYLEGSYLRGGYIDTAGRVVAESFYPPDSHEAETPSRPPRRLLPVRTAAGFAYATRSGGPVISLPRFSSGRPFSEGLAAVCFSDDGSRPRWGYIDESGKTIIEAKYLEAGQFTEGAAAVRDQAGRYGYLDRAGVWLIEPAFYEEAGEFHAGLARVRLNDMYGYIDKSGRFNSPPRFARATDFREGLAAVAVAR